jgi:hypothetical protein
VWIVGGTRNSLEMDGHSWNFEYALAVGILILVMYLVYEAVLPKPLPGIPYNHGAPNKIFGDIPEMMGYVIRTKRIFVSCTQVVHITHGPN